MGNFFICCISAFLCWLKKFLLHNWWPTTTHQLIHSCRCNAENERTSDDEENNQSVFGLTKTIFLDLFLSSKNLCAKSRRVLGWDCEWKFNIIRKCKKLAKVNWKSSTLVSDWVWGLTQVTLSNLFFIKEKGHSSVNGHHQTDAFPLNLVSGFSFCSFNDKDVFFFQSSLLLSHRDNYCTQFLIWIYFDFCAFLDPFHFSF